MNQRVAIQLLLLQLLALVFVTALWSASGLLAVKSTFLGGLTFLVPNLYFTRQFFRRRFARQARQIVANMAWAEITKFLLMGIILVLVVTQCRVNLLAYITGFIGCQAGTWLLPLTLMKKEGAP